MSESLLHIRENNPETENHLHDNADKFNKQNKRVLELLYSGKRYTSKMINDILNITDGGRRLREIFAARNDVKRDWAYDKNGKTSVKEYWMEIPQYPTKKELTEWFNKYLKGKPDAILIQKELF